MTETYTFVTLAERPDLVDAVNQLHNLGWAKYMGEDPVALKHWEKLFTWFPSFQYVLLDEQAFPVACGNAIPFIWDGEDATIPSGWDAVFKKGVSDYEDKAQVNALSALAIVIHPEHQGKGISKRMVQEMKNIALKNSFEHMIAPVRPSLKHLYPLIPMEEYVKWEREDGSIFDPWIRTHCALGAKFIKVAEKSMVIPGSIKDWEKWANLQLPATGSYVIASGLVPLVVDKEANQGLYVEPNVWLRHI